MIGSHCFYVIYGYNSAIFLDSTKMATPDAKPTDYKQLPECIEDDERGHVAVRVGGPRTISSTAIVVERGCLICMMMSIGLMLMLIIIMSITPSAPCAQ